MYHTFTAKGNRRYRYYVHKEVLKRGQARGNTRSVPAGDIENFVIARIQAIGQSSQLAAETFWQARLMRGTRIDGLEARVKEVRAGMARSERQIHACAGRTHESSLAQKRVRHQLARLGGITRARVT